MSPHVYDRAVKPGQAFKWKTENWQVRFSPGFAGLILMSLTQLEFELRGEYSGVTFIFPCCVGPTLDAGSALEGCIIAELSKMRTIAALSSRLVGLFEEDFDEEVKCLP